jgi:hypothetical protein
MSTLAVLPLPVPYSDHLAPGPAFPKSNVDARPASASDLAVRRGVNSTAEGLSKDD